MRRKHNPGCQCCGECCGPLEAPAETVLVTPAGETKLDSDWTTDPCCKTVTLYPTSTAWQYACSDAARTQTIVESVNYQVYLRDLQVVGGSSAPTVECVVNKDGSTTCTTVDADGNPITCDETQTLCTTIAQSATRIRTLHAAAKYRISKIETTIYRVTTTCDSETIATCKFILVARAYVDIFYGNVIKEFLDYDLTGETSCCVVASSFDRSILIDETCQDAVDRTGLTFAEVILTRSKWYTSMPSGTVTLTPTDEINCASTLPGCVSPVGDQTISVETSNSGIWSTVTANCTNNEVTTACRGLYDSGAAECLPFVISETTTRSVGTVVSNLLASLSLTGDIQYVCNAASTDGNPDTIPCEQKEVWDTPCQGLSSSVTDTGYTAKTLSLFSGNWVLSITP